ncbi:hypothetical protein FOA52_007332 [Chlamydomonas sp. UWO 241]|nr:hypothetical protein FOA52_007332 [Chlamydomonas sp. UWO 241]
MSGTDAKGAAWSSSVHVLGVHHHSAANAWAVHEVATSVEPDAVGMEYDSMDRAARNRFTKTAKSAPMRKLVNRLMETPLESYQQAHGQLTAVECAVWMKAVTATGLYPSYVDELAEMRHHLLGAPAHSETIAAAFIARKLGAVCVHRLSGRLEHEC